MTRPRIIVLVTVGIAAATLFSTGNGVTRPFSFCLTCNFRWLADWLANTAMFLPLGCAMNWKRRHFLRTTLRAAAFSMVIELAQTTIPGRDPALADVLANSFGGALGAALGSRPEAWIVPRRRTAPWLLALVVTSVAIIVGETEWLLAPASSVGTGSRLSSAVDALFRGQATMAFTTVSSPGPTETAILSLGPPPPLQVLYVGRLSSDAVFRYRTRGRELRLDEPDYVAPGFFDGLTKPETLRISVNRQGPEWCVSRTGKRECGIGPTVGRGWAILHYSYNVGRRWQRALDVIWVAALFLPLGFWSGRRTVLLSIAAGIIILGPIARFAPLVATPPAQWLGAGVGFALGFGARMWLSTLWGRRTVAPPALPSLS